MPPFNLKKPGSRRNARTRAFFLFRVNTPHMSTAPRILIFRLSSMGDVILCTSALEAIRARSPGARITWVIAREFADLLQGDPRIERVVAFDRTRGRAGLFAGFRDWHRMLRALFLSQDSPSARPGFDEVIDLHGSIRTRYAALLHGYLRWRNQIHGGWTTLSKQRGRRWAYFTLKRLLPRSLRPAAGGGLARRVARLVAQGHPAQLQAYPSLRHLLDRPIRSESVDWIEASLRSDALRIAVMPGAAWAGKRWPTHRFFRAMAAFQEDQASRSGRTVQWFILGKPGERACEDLFRVASQAGLSIASAHRQLDLVEQAQLLSRCSVLLSNDTGMVHLAESIGIPAVALFGPTQPELGFGPWSSQSRSVCSSLWCSPCSKDGSACFRMGKSRFACLDEIPAKDVVSALRAVANGEAGVGATDRAASRVREQRRLVWAGRGYLFVVRLLARLVRLVLGLVRGFDWNWRKSPPVRRPMAGLVWFHAASAGELEMLWEVAREVRARGLEIGLSVFSPSGAKGIERFKAEFSPVYAGASPIEGEWSEFFKQFLPLAPVGWVTSKYEAWPELWSCLAARGIPLFTVNADERPSLRVASKVTRACFGALPEIHLATVDSDSRLRLEASALRAHWASAPVQTGDPRWDRVASRFQKPSSRLSEIMARVGAKDLPRPWWVLGSAWQEDLDFLLPQLGRLGFNGTLWVVPHSLTAASLQRQERALELYLGSPPIRTSSALEPATSAGVLVDELGVLVELYTQADLAWVGGGFKTGLHSVIEPALAQIPVACAPRGASRFPEVAALASSGQLSLVQTPADLEGWWTQWSHWVRPGPQAVTEGWRTVYQLGASGRCAEWILNGIKAQ